MSGPVVGLDVGGTKIAAVAINEECQVIGEAVSPVPRGGSVSVNDVLAAMTQAVRAVTGGADPARLGAGRPGMVTREGRMTVAPNLPAATGVDFTAELSRIFPSAKVVVVNDADAATVAEHRVGAAVGHDNVLMVTLGTGIGGGLILDGKIRRGAHGFAGEIGHMVLDPSGPACPCGQRGCFERYASGSGLARLAREAAMSGHLSSIVTALGGDSEAVRGEDVAAAARGGDAEALAVFDELGWWLARGVANLAMIIDFSLVVVGGGLSDIADLFLPAAQRHLPELCEGWSYRAPLPMVTSTVGTRAGALGAAVMAADL